MSSSETLGPPWTILKILRWTTDFLGERGCDSPRVDAEILLGHALDLPRIQLYAQFDRPLIESELSAYRQMIKRRAAGEPVAYILGERGFWNITLKTDARALIPRPDTETLVEAALKLLPAPDADQELRLADIGTGTGAIALALAAERPDLRVAATDISAETLGLAKENAELLDLSDRVSFFQGDLLQALPADWHALDMLVSNPPYIGESEREELMRDVRDFEPAAALFSGEDGLDILRRLIPASLDVLKPGAYLLLEIGYRQGAAVTGLLEDAGFKDIDILPDLGGRDRVARARRP
ncbi:peptide chain release factor N(5)-glutamine methyltransferase [Lujinxingia litoralis]|uniref:Release factor glutamine methyltransferase n=1 Tax=Lujinxingia litoralis TaxID=2211119 RepID=A0A328CAK7_9DELT|nr:peptide chain release factor N(5)-glutamine methyltransferase [Lujinxingia litoralis]RAL22287.1 peptide chain release factor N(5)-glutamine methyltransferase [Lujinxingia litoralis]